jgi:ATP-dependent protease ClpP protease subunit
MLRRQRVRARVRVLDGDDDDFLSRIGADESGKIRISVSLIGSEVTLSSEGYRPHRLVALVVSICFYGIMAHCALGADISAGRDGDGNDIIILRGPIEIGDAAKVNQLKTQLGDYSRTRRVLAAIHLDSPGGTYTEALKIVDAIYPLDPIGTVVNEGASCYSACALIFMAGHTGGGSAGIFANRRLHHRARLGFHAPYLKGVQGQFSGSAIEDSYRMAVASLRELMAKKVISASLLTEMLGKGPNEAFVIDTVDKAGRWDIQVVGYPKFPITRKMFCTACENHSFWTADQSSISSRCGERGTIGNQPDGFNMRQHGSDYYIRVFFPLSRGHSTECKVIVKPDATTFNNMPFVVGTFGPPGRDIDQNDHNRFEIYPFHYFDASSPLHDLGR